MRAAVLYEPGRPLVVEEVELDPPRAGEVLVRMAASGVCHSDLHTADGAQPCPLPTVLGHEGAGVVEEVGPGVDGLAAGDHVVLTWLPYCGRCRMCTRGRPALCENLAWSDAGTMADGTVRLHRAGVDIRHYTTSSFAEAAVVPAQTCIRVDPSLPLAELALVGCAVTTGVGAVLNTARVRPGDTVAVVGCGGVGLSAIQGAVVAGAERIVAVDVSDAKLELARTLGATDTVDARSGDAAAAVRDAVPGGVDHAFEALGRPETIRTAIDATARGGQAVVIGMADPGVSVDFEPLALTVEEKAIRGSWYGSIRPPVDVPLVVDLYRRGRLRLDLLVTPCSLDDVNEALGAIRDGTAVRGVIVF